jgi:hypothetical protein
VADRPTRARRRFHTDRIVAARRARYLREDSGWAPLEFPEWVRKHLSYGALADRDPWDCGRSHCGCCHSHTFEPGRDRRLGEREWRAEEWE